MLLRRSRVAASSSISLKLYSTPFTHGGTRPVSLRLLMLRINLSLGTPNKDPFRKVSPSAKNGSHTLHPAKHSSKKWSISFLRSKTRLKMLWTNSKMYRRMSTKDYTSSFPSYSMSTGLPSTIETFTGPPLLIGRISETLLKTQRKPPTRSPKTFGTKLMMNSSTSQKNTLHCGGLNSARHKSSRTS